MQTPETEAEILAQLRRQIDQTDRKIVELIIERARLVQSVGQTKQNSGSAIYRPDREKQVYQNIERYVQELTGDEEGMPVSVFKHVYREIMSGSIALEGGPSVAYLGPEASFSHQATRSRFGNSLRFQPVYSISDVFRSVESGQEARFGVVPIENTIAGTVGMTLDRLLHTELNIYAEHYTHIQMNLLAKCHMELPEIRKLYTFKVASEQCREWLHSHLNMGSIEIEETPSTADAARLAALNGDGAAIASEFAAETYQLRTLRSHIQDSPYNITRFFVIGFEQCPPTGDDKTSIYCRVKDNPGSLYGVLQPFQKGGINLTRIESRTTRRSFGEYNFFIDFAGHRNDPEVQAILKEIEASTSVLRILGSYPRMELPLA
ncbi:MAG: prephenate dehydratase [Leptospiraceae bacterium]|nr:prephenate dehydratase [Leptospiraceae bacterium]